MEKYIEPDLEFVTELKRFGGDDLKKCYQCATCSVVCNLSHDERPFPRKEMIWAQWGLKERLVYDADIWLCHQCGDCTAKCPRGAKPSSVLAAVRNSAFGKLAFPSFMGKALSSPLYLPVLIAIPVLALFTVFLISTGGVVPVGTIVYSKFMPIKAVDGLFLPAVLFSLFCAVVGVKRFWDRLVKNGPLPENANFASAALDTIKDLLTHRRFGKCDVNRAKRWGHLTLFFGIAALFITTNMVMAYHYLFHIETPLELTDPVKLLGNFGAVFGLVGCTWLIVMRFGSKDSSVYYDWAFVTAVWLTIATGILSEFFRLTDIRALAFPTYFTHLVLVFFLIVYMPFSKFAHILYRTTAMIYSTASKRR